jgi:hypothetical protein
MREEIIGEIWSQSGQESEIKSGDRQVTFN